MMDYFYTNLWQLWALLAIICLILELFTGGFFIMCFAIGAFIATLSSVFCSPMCQLAVFVVVSGISIFMVRPFALRYLHSDSHQRVSNADALLGRIGTVSETIAANGFGRVAIDGDDWKAVADTTDEIAVGTRVKVIGRESIIITVERV